MDKITYGKLGEEKAQQFLKQQGYKILAVNYQLRCGEIDIIAQKGKVIIFAEVKTRSDLGRALNQAEKGLIQHYIENNHPLLNKKLMADHFDEITSLGNTIDLVDADIWVYSTQSTR